MPPGGSLKYNGASIVEGCLVFYGSKLDLDTEAKEFDGNLMKPHDAYTYSA